MYNNDSKDKTITTTTSTLFIRMCYKL